MYLVHKGKNSDRILSTINREVRSEFEVPGMSKVIQKTSGGRETKSLVVAENVRDFAGAIWRFASRTEWGLCYLRSIKRSLWSQFCGGSQSHNRESSRSLVFAVQYLVGRFSGQPGNFEKGHRVPISALVS